MSDLSNLYQTTKNAPEDMPVYVIKEIKDAICPAPMNPSVANARVVSLNKEIQKQADAIALLEKHVVELEQRYQLQFSVGEVNVFTKNASNQQPILDISGNIPNILFNFAVPQPAAGLDGPPGNPGRVGNMGGSGLPGPSGKTGYWGNRG